MSHRTVITNSFTTIFSSPDVRAEMTAAQCACVDEILQNSEPSTQQIKELAHRAVQVYKSLDE